MTAGQRCGTWFSHHENCRMCTVIRMMWWYLALKAAFITGLIAAEHFGK